MSKIFYMGVPVKHESLTKQEVFDRIAKAVSACGHSVFSDLDDSFEGDFAVVCNIEDSERAKRVLEGENPIGHLVSNSTLSNGYGVEVGILIETPFSTLEEFEAHCQELAERKANKVKPSLESLISKVQQWGRDKGINDPYKQALKTLEELGELSSSLLKGKREEEIDAVGDVLVCLSVYCDIRGVDIAEALNAAYNVISKRTGKNVDGCFIKDEKEDKA